MLVSVTLVLLMMTLFAGIFSMATDSVSRQKGIAELDQGARILTNNFRADLAKRTFRYGMPYYPGENASTSPTPFGNRAGYLYVSANDPASGIDDVLQFSANSSLTNEENDSTPYFGAAALLYDRIAELESVAHATDLTFNPNQPEADDSILSPNGAMASRGAEISYFLRNGNLYRRVMLLRDPLPQVGGEQVVEPASTQHDTDYFINEGDMAPSGGTILAGDGGGRFWVVTSPQNITRGGANNFVIPAGDTECANRDAWNVVQSNDLWRYFDISAVPSGTGAGGMNPSSGVQLLGMSALANDSGIASLGNPAYRWGFNFYSGQSREHGGTAGSIFLGRFLHAETSDWRFNWPMSGARNEPAFTGDPTCGNTPDFSGSLIGSGTVLGNPMSLTNVPLTLNSAGVVSNFDGTESASDTIARGGPRAVEDLLLTNVHEFRVEIWDERLGQFVVPGYGTVSGGTGELLGDYHIRRCLQADTSSGQFHMGPLAPYTPSNTNPRNQPHVFDTGHPSLGSSAIYNFDGDASTDQLFEVSPPYLPYRFSPPVFPDGPTSPLVPNPINVESREIRVFSSNEVRDIQCTNRGYFTPTTVTTPQTYAINDVVFMPWIEQPQPNPAGGPNLPIDGVFQYNEIEEPRFHIGYRCVVGGDPGATIPTNWPKTPGLRVTQGGTQWEAFDNRQPLKTIRIKLRFQEPGTELLRQLTLQMPITLSE